LLLVISYFIPGRNRIRSLSTQVSLEPEASPIWF
jgi:hypothetical protein